MYICVCNGVTDKEIKSCLDSNGNSFSKLQSKTKAGTCCGCCVDEIKHIMEEKRVSNTLNEMNVLEQQTNENVMFFENPNQNNQESKNKATDKLNGNDELKKRKFKP